MAEITSAKTRNPDGSLTITMTLDGYEANGERRKIVVTLPPGRELDTVTVCELVESLARTVRNRGQA